MAASAKSDRNKAGAGGANSGRTRIFVSYSRRDLLFANALTEALENVVFEEKDAFQVLIDRRDLPYGEEWKHELLSLIENCDAVVFVVSPHSIASQWCAWELEQVQRLSKRLVPIVIQPIDSRLLPPAIADRQVLPFNADSDDDTGTRFNDSLSLLTATLLTDYRWVKEHSRIGDRARQWVARGYDKSLLLRGAALRDAELWMDRRPTGAPPPNEDMLKLVLGSRQAATRRLRWSIAGALTVAAVALGLAAVAGWQRQVAVANENRAQEQRRLAQENESRLLADLSDRELAAGDAETASLLALEGLPALDAFSARPLVMEARQALYNSLWNRRSLGVFRRRPIAEMFAPILPIAKDYMANQDKFKDLKDKPLGELRSTYADVVDVMLDSYMRSAAISADGRYAAADFANGRITIWDVTTGTIIADPVCHGPTASADLKELFESQSFATWLADGTLMVRRHPLSGAKTTNFSVCAWRGGKLLNSIVEANGQVRVLDAAGRELNSFAIPDKAKIEIWLSSHAPLVLLGMRGDPTVHLVDLSGASPPLAFPAMTSDGIPRGLSTWQVDGSIACSENGIYDLRTGKQLAAFKRPDRAFSNCRPIAANQRVVTFFTGEGAGPQKGQTLGWLTVWDSDSGDVVKEHVFSTPRAGKPSAQQKQTNALGLNSAELDHLDRLDILLSIRPVISADGEHFMISGPDRREHLFQTRDGTLAWSSSGEEASTLVARGLSIRVPQTRMGLEETAERAEAILKRLSAAESTVRLDIRFHPYRPQMIIARSDPAGGRAIEAWNLETGRLDQRLATLKADDVNMSISTADGDARLIVTSELDKAVPTGRMKRAWVFAEGMTPMGDELGLSLRFGSKKSWRQVLSLDSVLLLQTTVTPAAKTDVLMTLQEMGTRLAVWSMAADGGGVQAITAEADELHYGFKIGQLGFDATGAHLAAEFRGKVHLWNLTGATPVAAAELNLDAGSKRSSTPTSAADDIVGTARLNEADATIFLSARLDTSSSSLRPLRFPDGSQLLALTGTFALIRDGSNTRLIDVDTQKDVSVIETGHEQMEDDTEATGYLSTIRKTVVALSRSGRRIVMNDANELPTIFDGVTGKVIAPLAGPTLEGLDLMRFGVSGRLGRVVRTLGALAISPDESMIVGALAIGNDAFVWNANTGEIAHRLKGHGDGIQAVAFSPDSRLVATGSKDGTTRLWDARTGELRLTMAGHADAVTAIAFHPTLKTIATASADGTIRIWQYFQNDEDAVAFARKVTPHCLGAAKRALHRLEGDLPAWCAELGKPPQYALEVFGTSLGLNTLDMERILRRVSSPR